MTKNVLRILKALIPLGSLRIRTADSAKVIEYSFGSGRVRRFFPPSILFFPSAFEQAGTWERILL